MATAQRYPRGHTPGKQDAEYQRLAEQHSKYEAELQKTLRNSLPELRRTC